VVCHSLLQWTTFCQTMTHLRLSTRPVPLGLLYTTWLIASLSYTRLWSMWSFWLVFCDGSFHSVGHEIVVLASSVCLRMDEDKRLVWPWSKKCSRAKVTKSFPGEHTGHSRHPSSQLFVRPPQTTILPCCISFSWQWFWSLPPIQSYWPLFIGLQALSLSDLIPWIYLSLPLCNHKGFDLGHAWMAYWFSLLSSI